MEKLSVVIITLNEEKNIRRCIESVKSIADEIIVMDSFSTDSTESICKEYGAKFYSEKWLGYSEQKNLANSLATNNLLFSIDADEALSPELEKSIIYTKQTIKAGEAFIVKRLTNYCGKWIKHSGWYPDAKLRIWFKSDGKWEGDLHENIILNNNCNINTLKGDLFHYSYYSINQHIAQFNKFTEIGATDAFKRGKKSNWFIASYKSIWKFKRDYFFKLGFLDGYYGFIICSISAFATFTKYIKLKELHKNANK